MFSKLSSWAPIISLVLLAGCMPKVGEDAPPQTEVEISGTACLGDAAEQVKKIFYGTATAIEIHSGFNCIETAFEKFSKYVRGRQQDRYTSQELAEFFETYFMSKSAAGQPVRRIHQQMQIELMKIKQLFVGGSREYVTRPELELTKNLISNLRNLALDLNPYMKIYVHKWQRSEDQKADFDFFEESNLALQEFAEKFSEFILPEHEPYSFQDFIGLMGSLEVFYGEKWEFSQILNEYLPLIQKVKKTVAGGAEEAIHPGEWRSFLLLGARAYVQYTRYTYFIRIDPTSSQSIGTRFIVKAIEDLFSSFEQLVREKPELGSRRSGNRGNQGKITRDELYELATALSDVWSSFKVSETLLDEVMRLKKVLLGGKLTDWSYLDFANGREKIVKMEPLFEKFLPYFRVYVQEWDPNRMGQQESQAYFTEAQDSLIEVVGELGQFMESSYQMSHLKTLLAEIEHLYPSEHKSRRLAQQFDKYYPLVELAKNILFEDEDDWIRKENWPSFLSFGSRVYSIYLNYAYFLRDSDLKDQKGLLGLKHLIYSALNSVESVLRTKPSHLLNKSEIAKLSLELQKIELLPREIKASTLEKAIDVAVNSILNPPQRRLQGYKPQGVDDVSLQYVRNEVDIWLESEIFLRGLFGEGNSQFTLSPYELQQKIDEKLADPFLGQILRLSLLEMKRVVSSPVPMVLDDKGRMMISSQMVYDYNWDSISRLNLARMASRTLIRSFAGDERRIEGIGLSKAEAQAAYDDIKGIFIDLDYLEANNASFINSRFLEANIFVPRSDGNTYASFLELTDILSMILSGIELDSDLKPALTQDCLRGVTEVSKSSTVDYMCLLNSYRRNVPLHLTSLPDYLVYLKANDSCDTELAFFNLIKAAGYVPNQNQRVSMGDVALIPHVIQYLEMAYAKFDIEKDGYLDRHDAKKAYPVFEDLFTSLAEDYIKKGFLSKKDMWPLFTYVLSKGKVPENIGDFMGFFFWKNMSEDQWKFKTDRNMLTAILGEVADRVAKPAGVITAYVKSYEVTSTHFSDQCRDKIIGEPPEDPTELPGFAAFHE